MRSGSDPHKFFRFNKQASVTAIFKQRFVFVNVAMAPADNTL